ncbi:MAG: hypothetical protein K0U93_00645 [Gammaproteobacteria bacterium]|nr:hypothetical protein [Gammaproteobacteria bacterium]
MPELPEVERGRLVAHEVAHGRVIAKVQCAPDEIVLDGVGPRDFAAALTGRTVHAVRRWGKQLWFELDEAPHPLFHFGMTGGFRIRDTAPLQLKSGPTEVPHEWPPRFAKVHLWFDDGGELVFADGRRLGRVLLRRDPRGEPPLSRLGPDPVHNMPTPAAFRSMMQSRSSVIKSLLLDQSVLAGLGNWMADEVLYQSKIDPRRRACDLSDVETERLRKKILLVVRRAVAANADDGQYPKTWLFHQRWGRKADATTASGAPIHHITLGGRTTAWVPSVQS